MRVDGIYIKDFLSYDTFEWSGLDHHLNIAVGPNGSGKTNLLQVLRAVKDILNPYKGQQKALWAQNTYRGSSRPSVEIRLNIHFNDTWERQLLSTFIAATFCNDPVLQEVFSNLRGGNNDIPNDTIGEQELFSATLLDEINSTNLEWLFNGYLVVNYSRGNWTYWYQLHYDNQVLKLNLDGFSTLDGSVQVSYLKELSSRKAAFTSIGQQLLVTLLSKAARPSIPLLVEQRSYAVLATHQALEQLTGERITNTNSLGISSVFHLLFSRAVIFTDNIRVQPLYKFSPERLHTQPIDLSSGEQLARYLFLKKNAPKSERDQYRATQEMFYRVTGRSFEVSLYKPEVQIDTESKSDVELTIFVTDHWGEIPLAFSGAGIAEALFICTLIAAGKNQVVLLDEPASNIHTIMQKALLKEIQAVNKNSNQFIIVTHSPALISPDAISKVSRFFMYQGNTRRASLDRNVMQAEEFASLEKELRRSTDTCALLFSRGVILVEGETEQGALPIWFEKQFGSFLESDDIIVYSVNSDKNFGNFVRFLHQFKIPWVIICDGKVIGDNISLGSKPRIIRQLGKAGVSPLPDYKNKDFLQLCLELKKWGIFTLAQNVDDEIEALPTIQTYQQEANSQVGNSKVRQAQYIATTYDCPPEVATLLEEVLHHLRNLS